jgi:hypothetical protein
MRDVEFAGVFVVEFERIWAEAPLACMYMYMILYIYLSGRTWEFQENL